MKQFLKLTKNDPAAFETLVQETITNLENYRREFREALLAGNKEIFRQLAHKIKMTAAMLRADKLQKMLDQTVGLLEEGNLTKEELTQLDEQIDPAFNTLIDSLKKSV